MTITHSYYQKTKAAQRNIQKKNLSVPSNPYCLLKFQSKINSFYFDHISFAFLIKSYFFNLILHGKHITVRESRWIFIIVNRQSCKEYTSPCIQKQTNSVMFYLLTLCCVLSQRFYFLDKRPFLFLSRVSYLLLTTEADGDKNNSTKCQQTIRSWEERVNPFICIWRCGNFSALLLEKFRWSCQKLSENREKYLFRQFVWDLLLKINIDFYTPKFQF